MSQPAHRSPACRAGQVAAAGETHLRTYAVGAVPIINRFLQRLQLAEILARHLPAEDGATC